MRVYRNRCLSVAASLCAFALLPAITIPCAGPGAAAVIDDAADLATQQAQERAELGEMRKEMKDLKSTMSEGANAMNQLRQNIEQRGKVQDIQLAAKESNWEIVGGTSVQALTYNGELPGPVLRIKEGQPVRIVLKNEMRVPTSMAFHGVLLPHSVGGLPRKGAGLVEPGQSYAFQFYAPKPGTYWYHPQVLHSDQMARGLYGALIVEPVNSPRTYEKDVVLVLGESSVPKPGGKANYFTVNGKSAPAIPAIELRNGERVRLRVINAAPVDCPLFLSGHQFEIVSTNGADGLEPRVTRDTLTLHPGDRYDLEFTANNPGVWSLASLLPAQTNNDGKFPGGMAVVVRYPEVLR